MASGSISKGFDNYLEKIHCLVACLNSEEWIVAANQQSVQTLYRTAVEIEECMTRSEAQKIHESLRIVFPHHNFQRCGDIVMETILLHPQTPEETLIYAVDKYLEIYPPNYLCHLLYRLVQGKKIKDQAMQVISTYGDGSLMKRFEAICCIQLCEQMVASNDVNFEYYVRGLLENDTALCINSISLSPPELGRIILEFVLKHLNDDRELKTWFSMLSNRNIGATSLLLAQFPELLEALLKFFDNYAAGAEFSDGEPFSWSHRLFPLNDFVVIFNYLLTSDGVVGATVNDFLTQKIVEMKEGFSFWLDVKSLL